MTILRQFGRRVWPVDVSGYAYIETGIDRGNSMQNACAHFPSFSRIVGIEIHPEYARLAKEKFKDDARVEIYQGDSAVLLPAVIDPYRKTVFWLDAHWCEAFQGEEGRQSPDYGVCALLPELRAIASAGWKVKPTVLIDDAFIFCSKTEFSLRHRHPTVKDYPTFADIYDALGGSEGKFDFTIAHGPEGGVIYCF